MIDLGAFGVVVSNIEAVSLAGLERLLGVDVAWISTFWTEVDHGLSFRSLQI